MRNLLIILICLGLLGVANGEDADHSARLVLLGTAGGPGGKVKRAGIASLVVVGEKRYLIDAGEGVARQLAHVGLAERDIPTVFLTHLHDDHTAGLPGLLSFAHTKRGRGVEVIGPPRTQHLVEDVLGYLATNAEIRMAEQPRLGPPADVISGRDVGTGAVFDDGVIKVTAIENTHYHIEPGKVAARNKSYSYRFETPGGVIVFTGDTGPSEAVEELARGANILVSEMVSADDLGNVPPDVIPHMLEEHLVPEEVGQLAAKAGVQALVLSHINNVSDEDLAGIRQHFEGPVTVGADLDRFKLD